MQKLTTNNIINCLYLLKYWITIMTELIFKVAFPLASTILAGVAIYFTWQQSRSNRLHNELSIRPAICSNVEPKVEHFTFSITNKGLGPAKVDAFKFFHEDKLISYELFERIINEKYRNYCAYQKPPVCSNQVQDSYIAKDETIIILQLVFHDKVTQDRKTAIANEIESSFALEFDYTSFYDESIKNKFKFSTKH